MNNSIEVWDVTFYKVNEDGDTVIDSEGNVQLYNAPNIDCSYIAEGVNDNDLEEVDIEDMIIQTSWPNN